MSDISVYFNVAKEIFRSVPDEEKISLGHFTEFHDEKGFPGLDGKQIAIFGVMEERGNPDNEGCSNGAEVIRKHLYGLRCGNFKPSFADLGNILPGSTIDDTYFAVREVMHELMRRQIMPVLIGGSNDLAFANYLAYTNIEPTINIVSCDSNFDLGRPEDPMSAASWVGKVILHQPNHLFNFSNVGYQSYFVDETSLNLMSKLFFDAHRLGQLRPDMEEVEPILRNADMFAFDITSVKSSDAPGHAFPNPNGFYGEEACRIARYAGMNDKLTSAGFYEYNPRYDQREQTAKLLSQVIWYFLEGYYSRKKDFPFKNTSDYQKYHVGIKGHESEIIFYKSLKSDRWWMEVPYPPDKRLRVQRHCLVPCSYADYEVALTEEVPDRWWQTFQKLG